MLTSQNIQTKPPNDYADLHPTNPAGWQAKEIVYSKISLSLIPPPPPPLGTPPDPNAKMKLYFTASPSSAVFNTKPIDEFARGLLAGPALGGVERQLRDPPPPLIPPPGPIDIVVEQACYVVIELDSAIDWQFRSGGAGVTAKADYSDDNCELRHVNADGTITVDAPGKNGCRIIYFSVVRRQNGVDDRQHFNLHVEFPQAAGYNSIEIIIDPDVPNNGGIFNFDPI